MHWALAQKDFYECVCEYGFVHLLFELDRRSLSMAYFFLGVAFSTFAADERRRLSPAAFDIAVPWIWAVGSAPSLSAVALLGADGVLPARLSYEHPGLPQRVSRSAVYSGLFGTWSFTPIQAVGGSRYGRRGWRCLSRVPRRPPSRVRPPS